MWPSMPLPTSAAVKAARCSIDHLDLLIALNTFLLFSEARSPGAAAYDIFSREIARIYFGFSFTTHWLLSKEDGRLPVLLSCIQYDC